MYLFFFRIKLYIYNQIYIYIQPPYEKFLVVNLTKNRKKSYRGLGSTKARNLRGQVYAVFVPVPWLLEGHLSKIHVMDLMIFHKCIPAFGHIWIKWAWSCHIVFVSNYQGRWIVTFLWKSVLFSVPSIKFPDKICMWPIDLSKYIKAFSQLVLLLFICTKVLTVGSGMAHESSQVSSGSIWT